MLSMEEIYQEYAKTVYRYLLTLTRNADVAEELTQETFYQAVKSIERFDGKCKISTWLCAIAKNCFYSYQRKHPESLSLEEEIYSEGEVDDALLKSEAKVELLRKMRCLGEETREVMYLRIFGELSFKEIGAVLSKTENWARVTYYRGKEKLRKELEADE